MYREGLHAIATQVVLRSHPVGFASAAETTWDLSDEQVMDIPYWYLSGRHTFSETSCSFLRPDPFPQRIGKKV